MLISIMFTTCWLWQMTRQQDQDWVISIREQTSSKKTTRALDKLIWSSDNKPMCDMLCWMSESLLLTVFCVLVQTLPTLQANSELKWWKETIVRIATDGKTKERRLSEHCVALQINKNTNLWGTRPHWKGELPWQKEKLFRQHGNWKRGGGVFISFGQTATDAPMHM